MPINALALATVAGFAVTACAQPFSIVLLPDTQNYANSSSNAPLFTQQTRWSVDQVQGANPDNIVFVSHLGDVVSSGDSLTQLNRADTSLSILDGGLADSIIPWSVLPGNHDYADTGNKNTGTDDYLDFFGPARFAGKSWFGGAEASGNNTYQFFEGSGQTYLHLALEWQPTVNVTNGPVRDPSPVEWAQSIINDNPGIPTIVSTHAYLDDNPPGQASDGEALWNELIRRNDQIIMVLNGHYHSAGVPTNDGEYHQVSFNDFASPVIEVLQDYQDYPRGGDGWLRIVTFDPAADTVRFQTYSPVRDEFQTETVAQVGQFASDFTLPLDFTFDFADPPEPPVEVFETIVVQQGADGYTGTLDKEIRSSGGDANNGNAPSISVDGDDGSPGLQPNHGLIRFDGVVTATGIQPGEEIEDASLVLNVFNPGSGFTVYRMTSDWNESTTWQDLGGDGVTPGVDTDATPITTIGANNGSSNVGGGAVSLDISDAFDAWRSGTTNHGVALVPFPNGTNGIDFDTSEGSVPPAIAVRRLLPGVTRDAFRNGEGGYTGTVDFELRESEPNSQFLSTLIATLDADDPSGSGNETHVLIRFEDILSEIGNRAVVRATLTLNGVDAGSGGTMHRMLRNPAATSTVPSWNRWVDGVQADDIEAVSTPDAVAQGNAGTVEVDVTRSVQAWADGQPNFGWVILPLGDNGWDFSTSEASPALRPRLEIFFGEDPMCSPADLSAPFGIVDIDDVDAFIAAFIAGGSAADLAPPSGIVDIDDVDAFITLFLAGCP